jgi:hypothetical protein
VLERIWDTGGALCGMVMPCPSCKPQERAAPADVPAGRAKEEGGRHSARRPHQQPDRVVPRTKLCMQQTATVSTRPVAAFCRSSSLPPRPPAWPWLLPVDSGHSGRMAKPFIFFFRQTQGLPAISSTESYSWRCAAIARAARRRRRPARAATQAELAGGGGYLLVAGARPRGCTVRGLLPWHMTTFLATCRCCPAQRRPGLAGWRLSQAEYGLILSIKRPPCQNRSIQGRLSLSRMQTLSSCSTWTGSPTGWSGSRPHPCPNTPPSSVIGPRPSSAR